MDLNSHNLGLPYIAPAQAQKHITHNEAIRALDALVQISLKSLSQTTPPTSPSAGDRYGITNGANGASGEWAGHEGEIAAFQDGAWMFYTPNTGWQAWVEDENALKVWDGTDWQIVSGETQNIDLLGVNTTADTTNKLAVKSEAVLFDNMGAGVQFKVNKHTQTDTASILYQTGYSGRAEIGLAGDDNFHFKVSNDGNNWVDAIIIDSASGAISLSALTARIEFKNTGFNTIIGELAGSSLDMVSNTYNVFIGYSSGRFSTGTNNSAIGYSSFSSNISGNNNTCFGSYTAYYSTASNNTAIGYSALFETTTGASNTALGYYALGKNKTGSANAAFGYYALVYTVSGAINDNFSNCTGLGQDARVSGSNQVQLGNSSTTTYAFGAVQDRSDARDKADIRDTKLGLEFILSVRPVDYRLDMRDDYIEMVDDGKGGKKTKKLNKDGSKKRKRYHHGVIAQEIKQLMDKHGMDFGGYQDHSINGGDDILTIGYTEFIAPLIKAVQELAARIEVLEKSS